MVSNVTPSSGVAHVWYVILLLSLVNLFNSMDRMVLAILAPAIRSELHFSDSQLGLLTGFAFAVFYAVCGLPIARWADRGIRRDIIALALATWSLMTALSGAAQNFWHLLLARIGVGAGESGSYSPSASIICDCVPLRRRPAVFAIHTFGIVAGLILGLALGAKLSETIGWRWTFVALGVPGVLLAVVVRFSLREPVRGRFDPPAHETPPALAETMRALWRCRTYCLLVCYLIVNGFVQNGLSQWWPSFYSRVYEISLSSLGPPLGIAYGAGLGTGLLIGGLVGNLRRVRSDVRLPLQISAVVVTLALPASAASLFVSSVADSLLLVALAGLSWGVATGPAMAAVYSVIAPRMRATAGAVLTVFLSILGLGLGPFCVGVLSDMLMDVLGAESLRYALLLPVTMIPIMAIALNAAARALPRDLQQAGVLAADGQSVTAPANLLAAKS